MWQLISVKVSVQRWVIGPDVNGLLYVPGCALSFPVDYIKAVRANWMSCGVGM